MHESGRFHPGAALDLDGSDGTIVRYATVIVLALLYPFHFHVSTPVGTANTSAGDGVVLLIIALWLIGLLGRRSVPRVFIVVGPYVVMAALSVAVGFVLSTPGSSFQLDAGLSALVKLLGSTAWMVAIYLVIRRNPIRWIYTFAGTQVVLAAAIAVVTIAAGLALGRRSPSGPFANPNIYANWLLLNVYFAFLLSASPRSSGNLGIKRSLYLLVPVLIVGIVATGSRGALVGLLASTPFMVSLGGLRVRISASRVLGILCVLVASVLGGIWYWQNNPFIAQRISSVVSGTGPNIDSRFVRWSAAVDAWGGSPVFGVGYGQFAEYAAYRWDLGAYQTHNTYLAIAAETGLVGIMAFILLLGGLLVYGTRRTSDPQYRHLRFLTGFVIATCIHGIFTNVDNFRSLWIAFGMIASLWWTCGRNKSITMIRSQGSTSRASVLPHVR